MKITEVTSKTFFYSTKTVSDDEGHTHPDPDLKEHKVKTTLFSIHTEIFTGKVDWHILIFPLVKKHQKINFSCQV